MRIIRRIKAKLFWIRFHFSNRKCVPLSYFIEQEAFKISSLIKQARRTDDLFEIFFLLEDFYYSYPKNNQVIAWYHSLKLEIDNKESEILNFNTK